MFNYVTSIAYHAFGISNFSSRFFTMLAGFLSIGLVYLLSRIYFNRKVSVLAALLFAVNPLHVVYSRIAYFDVLMTFFSLAAIYFSELYFNKAKKKFFWLSAVFFTLSFLTKYSAIIVWIFYWGFLFARSAFRKDGKFRKYAVSFVLVNIISTVLVFFFVLFTGGLGRVFQMIHQIVLQFTIQSTTNEFPLFYNFSAFVNWLSPLVYALTIVSLVLFLLNIKKHKQGLYLMWWLMAANLLLLTILSRSHSRHFIPMIPFLMIVSAYGLYSIKPRLKKAWTLAVALILLSSFAWSVYEVNQLQGHTYFGDALDFVSENYPESPLIVHEDHYWSVYPFTENEVLAPHYFDFEYFVPDKGALIFLTATEDAPATRDRAPLDNNLLFFKKELNFSSEEFVDYVKEHGEKVFTGYYKNVPALEIYEITSVNPELTPGIKKFGGPVPANSLPMRLLWGSLCKTYRTESGKNFVNNVFPQEFLNIISNRC